MGRGLSDPSWKSGPTYPEPTSDEHALDCEPSGSDWDGFGKSEAEDVEGEPLVALQEYYSCHRDHCDEGMTRRLLFTTYYLTDEAEEALREAAPHDLGEYVWDKGERVDVDTIEVPVEGGVIGVTVEKTIEDDALGPCYGHEEPEPDLEAYRYDL